MEESPEINTKITAVTVYRDGARVERTGKLSLKPGTYKLQIPGLTRYLDKESVRLSGRGHASIVSFDTVDTTVEVSGYNQLDKLLKKQKGLKIKKDQIERELHRLSGRETFFDEIREKSAIEFSRWIPAGECEVERLTALETLITTQLEQLAKERTKIQETFEAVEKELAIVSREIDKFQREVSQYDITHTILLNVEVHKAGPCEFQVTYFVQQAAWTPSYDFDLAEEDATVTMYTVVQNNTREDWYDIQLTVSTASSRPATISEPSPYLLREYLPPPPRAVRKARAIPAAAPGEAAKRDEVKDALRTGTEIEELAMAVPPVPVPMMEEPTATAIETGGVHVFVLPDPVKVPADGEPHAFRTSHETLKAERQFFWNAVDFAEAIEVTTIQNGDTVLLPGKARVYSGDEYLGESLLKVVAPHEKVDVGMRFSYDLKVEKKLVEKSTEKTGFTRGNVAREYRYELIIQNFRKKISHIKLMDRMPHSDSEKIKVERKKFSHDPTEDHLSVLTWELDIPAEGELKIAYTFEVDYPRGLRITPPLP